jgi:hypothetical protein
MDSFMTEIDKPLFHYTSRDAFIKIFENKTLWASNILYLNDSEEFQYIFKLLRSLLPDYYDIYKDKDSDELKFLKTVERTHCLEKPFIYGTSTFVFSLTEERDLLSQWRGYANSSAGLSFGFRPDFLKKLIKRRNLDICKCLYKKDEQIGKIKEIVDGKLLKIRGWTNPLVWQHEYEEFLRDLLILAPTFKHPSFEQEQEWRLICQFAKPKGSGPVGKIKFRDGNSMIVPYAEIKLINEENDEDLKIELDEVVVGPNPHTDLSKISTELFLGQSGVIYTNVRESIIPYRSW